MKEYPIPLYWIKVVPESNPDADGEWIATPVQALASHRGHWDEISPEVDKHVPAGHFLVKTYVRLPDWKPSTEITA